MNPRRLSSLMAALSSTLIAATTVDADIIFVSAATGLPTAQQTGASWALAFGDLQTAITSAQSGDEIWVAAGTYRPTAGTDRTQSFSIPNGVRLFGGFPVGATTLAERRPLEQVTILSGDIGAPGAQDNSFHVVRFQNSSGLLSGFHVIGGNANGGGDNNFGGGIHATGGATVANCIISGNTAASAGSAMSAAGAGSVEIHQCIIVGNQSPGAGAALDFQFSSPRLFHCVVSRNVGGGMRCLNAFASSLVANSIFRNNTGVGTTLQQQITIVNSTVAVTHSNISGGGALGSGNFDAEPLFLDEAGSDRLLGTFDDRHALRGDSPCIDRGSSLTMPSDIADIDGDGNTSEQLPLDAASQVRRVDDLLATLAGSGAAPHADCGAFEYQRPRTILVDRDAAGANNGTSWRNAYTSLESAIAELKAPGTGGPGEIWVAEGTYVPTAIVNGSPTFAPGPGTRILGGFAGGELSRAARQPRIHRTILSGDALPAGPVGNSRHVVTFAASAIGNTTILDGVEVRDGVTTGTQGANDVGGGVLISGARPLIQNCLITHNGGSALGAAIGVVGTPQPGPTIAQCLITGNSSTGAGSGGIVILSGNARLEQCLIAENSSASANHGAVSAVASIAAVQNSLVFGNVSAGTSGFAAQVSSASALLTLSHTGVALLPAAGISGITKINAVALPTDGGLIDAAGPDGIIGTSDDDLRPTSCSGLLDAGSSEGLATDLFDLDEDGDRAEHFAGDYLGETRVVDLVEENVIPGLVGAIDIGLLERQLVGSAFGAQSADLNADGAVDAIDLGLLLGAWGSLSSNFDLTNDCFIDAADLAVLLGAWST